jgi:hypothetical protein
MKNYKPTNTWILVKNKPTDEEGVYFSEEQFNVWRSIGEPKEYVEMIRNSFPYKQWLKENQQMLKSVGWSDRRN